MGHDVRGETEKTIVRCGARIVTTVVIGFFGVFGALIAVPVMITEKTEPVENVVGLCLMCSALLWFFGAIRAATKAVVYERGVLVREWFTRYWVPWSAVTDIEAEPGVGLSLADGTFLALSAGEGSLLNRLRGNRYQHGLAQQIEEVWERSDDADTGDESSIKREWALGLTRLFVWLGLFLGMLGLTVALAK